jgi:hypothetical protein
MNKIHIISTDGGSRPNNELFQFLPEDVFLIDIKMTFIPMNN